MKVGVVGNARYAGLPAILAELGAMAAEHGAALSSEAELATRWPAAPPALDPSGIDALITFGGDGTLLRGARALGGRPIPILGVNLGRVGFLTAATRENWQAAVHSLLTGRYGVEPRQSLESSIRSRTHTRQLPIALNDVVVHKAGVARMIRLEVSVDGEPVGPYSADGIIVATPTGSTAYSLSAGGPIIATGVEALAITPICAHTLAVRPLVVRATSTIQITPMPGWEHDLLISVDGQQATRLDAEETLEIRRAPERVLLVQLPGHTYFHRIRHTLHWGDLSEREDA